jgi:peptidylprolyl isomerase domain and WD repeat-containing protein 1
MSDSEQDASVLGKRVRNDDEKNDRIPDNASPTNQDDDDDDDDVGPMPMPEAANGGTKKKRKGVYGCYICSEIQSNELDSFASRTGVGHCRYLVCYTQKLMDWQLFLDHLPNTDQYYKSFMHRDVINFCIATKWV